MSEMTRIEPLVGSIDGSNVVFNTPSPFVAATFRLIWNGITYPPDDDIRGYAVTGLDEVTLVTAPIAGDSLQGLYSQSTGVQTLAGLAAIPAAERADRQVRLVEDEDALYRFDLGASSGGIIPDDVDDGRWYLIDAVAFEGSPYHPSEIP